MNHPAKPAPLDPRDVPVWVAILQAASNDGHLAVRSGELATVLLLDSNLVPTSARELDAALERIIGTGRVERVPGGLRVVSWREYLGPRGAAADNDEDTPNGTT